jgi:hypothetical protein
VWWIFDFETDYMYTAVQKNRVHFKNQAIKFSRIFVFCKRFLF